MKSELRIQSIALLVSTACIWWAHIDRLHTEDKLFESLWMMIEIQNDEIESLREKQEELIETIDIISKIEEKRGPI
jgi:hypothetical protein